MKSIKQLCFIFNKLASAANIIIDNSKYEFWLKNECEKLVNYITERQNELNQFYYNPEEIRNELLEIQIPQDEIDEFLNAVNNKEVDKVSDFLHNLLSNRANYQNFSHDLYHKLTLVEDLCENKQNEELNPEEMVEQYFKSYQPLIIETNQNMQKLKSIITQAIERIEEWNDSIIKIIPNGLSENYNELSAQTGAEIQVGNNTICTFTIFNDDDKIIIEDILETGDVTEDEEFFSTSENKMDYFNLISELQSPSSTNKQKILTLYTARPTKDRNKYLNATEIPPNLFFTNKLSSAEGIAIDLAGNDDKIRDVWKVRINKKYLVETLNTGNEKQYQAIGTKPIPIELMILIIQGV